MGYYLTIPHHTQLNVITADRIIEKIMDVR